MAEDRVTSPPPRKRRRWLRILGWFVAVILVLLVALYFVATSSAFFKGVVLPQAGKSLNANITVSDASISPFSHVILRDLKVQTTGTEPLVSAAEVRLRYSLMDIIRGNLHVDEIAVASPSLTLIKNPDGTSNLDPILKAQKNAEAKPAPAKPSQPSKPPQVDLRKLAFTDVTLRSIKLHADGTRDTAEISHLNLSLDNVKNGQAGKFTVSADLGVDNHPPAPAAAGSLQGKVNGSFDFSLSPGLKPSTVKGNTHLEVTKAEGSLAQAASLSADLDCDLIPTELKQAALHFQKGSIALGQVRVHGPLDTEKSEGHLTVELLSVDKQLLNLAGASSGLDFGPTTINSTNDIQLSNGGSAITLGGQFNINQFQVTRAAQTTPPMDLKADYNVGVNKTQNSLTLQSITLNGSQKGNQFLHGELTSPMQISWGNTANAIGDSALNFTVTRFDLADWNAFLADVAPAGIINAQAKLLSQQGGKQLAFDLNSSVDNLAAGSGSNQISQAKVTLQLNAKAADLKKFDLTGCKLDVSRQNQPLLSASASGTCDQTVGSADLQLNGNLLLAHLLQTLPRPDVHISSGNAEFKMHIVQAQKTQNVTGALIVSDLDGQFGNNKFEKFGATADLDAGMTPQQVQLRNLSGKLTSSANPGGSFTLLGTVDLSTKAAQFTAKLDGFSQDSLRPFLQPMLGERKLASITINGNASAQYDPRAASTVKADFQMSNLVVNDPNHQIPATPLAAGMQLDASLNKQVADIRQCQLSLTPTSRATNQIQLTGHIDMTQSNATQGSLKLTADSLDFTTYYDLFTGQTKPAASSASPARPTTETPSPAPSKPEQEPPPVSLPLRAFTADASIRRIYLHELEIADLQASAKIDGGHVVLNPAKLTMNGAPVSATLDLDLGVSGYKYDFGFSAVAVPMEPLVNSFQPERKGQVKGTATAQAKITGAGITGPSLQQNLAGQFDMSSTNLNLAVSNIKNPVVKTLVNIVSSLPELLKNPGSIVSLVQTPGSGSSLSPELSKSPVDAIIARGTIGSGKVELQQSSVRSPAFETDVTGTITLAPILTNSTLNLPVSISLERSVAERLKQVSADTPTNAAYAKLPDFLTLVGTEGKPDKKVDKSALVEMAARSFGGSIPGLDKNAGGLVSGVRNLIGGGNTSTNAATATNNPPAQNQSPANNLLNGINSLFGPKKK